jgi:S-adenosylmethionine hydrolase
VAAYLSLGVEPDEFGSGIAKTTRLKLPTVKKSGHKLVGQIIHIDNFGNLVSNVSRQVLKMKNAARVRIKNKLIPAISRTFSDVGPGELVAYIGSSSLMEIGINLGNASQALRAKVGDKVEIQS